MNSLPRKNSSTFCMSVATRTSAGMTHRLKTSTTERRKSLCYACQLLCSHKLIRLLFSKSGRGENVRYHDEAVGRHKHSQSAEESTVCEEHGRNCSHTRLCVSQFINLTTTKVNGVF